MSDVVERLRASKQKQVDEVIQTGIKAGREWAERDAPFLDLRAIAEKVVLPEDPDDVSSDAIAGQIGKSIEDFFDRYIYGSPVARGTFKVASTETMARRDVVRDPYFQIGFHRGASAVWREVKDKI